MSSKLEVSSPINGLHVVTRNGRETVDVEEAVSAAIDSAPGFLNGYDWLGSSFTKARDLSHPRPYWSADHHWHYDLMQEGLGIGNLVTALSCTEAEDGAPGIEFVDSIRLHTHLLEMEFYAKLGYGVTELAGLHGEYSRAYFWNILLPTEIAKTEDTQTQSDVAKAIATFNTETGYIESSRFEADSTLPVITSTEEGDAITFDQERCFDFVDQEGRSHTELLEKLREHLAGMYSEYVELGIIHVQPLRPGTTLLFRREGLLHRSMPGNDFKRSITLSWLASNTPTGPLPTY